MMLQKNYLFIICGLVIGVLSANDVQAASSVRSLGGAGTYSSAEVASDSSAKTSTDTSSAVLRGGSVRVTSGSGQSASSTTIKTNNTSSAGRAATLPRLSIGQFLGGGTSISGGSSIKPQIPNDDSYTDGGFDSGMAADLQSEIDKLREEMYAETDSLHETDNDLQDAVDTKVDTISEANQVLQGTYEVTGTLIVPTQPLP